MLKYLIQSDVGLLLQLITTIVKYPMRCKKDLVRYNKGNILHYLIINFMLY